MLLLRRLHQQGSQQRPRRQVEGPQALGLGQPRERVRAARARETREIHQREPQLQLRRDHLHRPPPGHREGRPQRLVAAHQGRQTGRQGAGIEPAAQEHRGGEVVGRRPGLELRQEPEPLLREGERQRTLARRRSDRRCRQIPGRAAEGLDPRRQARDGRSFEEPAQRQLDPEGLAHPGDDARREERMTAEVEEAGAHADGGQPEDVGPDPGQQLLHRAPWGLAGGGCGLPGLRPARRQGAPVHLAARRQREAVDRHEGSRHHVVRQPVSQMRPQRPAQLTLPTGRHDEGRQTPPRPIALRHDHGLAHGGVRRERGLDLPQLDTEAADLDLMVDAAEEVDLAVRTPAGQVPGAVEPGAPAPGIRHESLSGQVRTAQIAARQSGAAKADLSGDADRHRQAARVQEVDRRRGDRPADGRQGRPLLHRARPQRGFSDHVGLGRPVLVAQHAAGKARKEGPHLGGDLELLAGGDDLAQRQLPTASGRRLGELLQGDERQEQALDTGLDQVAQQGHGVAADLVGHQHQGAPRGPGGEDLLHGHVEARRGELEGPSGRSRRGADLPGDQVGQRAVRQGHTLRLAR